ncbi:Ornithine aminotransferase 2 [compost metagenome]
MLAKEYLREAFTPGTHASTFGGNPVVTASIIATLETMKEENIPARAAKMSQYLMDRLREALNDEPFVKDIRGMGLIIGIECDGPVAELVTAGQKNKLLFVTAGPNVIRLLPNLKVSREEIDQAVDTIVALIAAHTAVKEEV